MRWVPKAHVSSERERRKLNAGNLRLILFVHFSRKKGQRKIEKIRDDDG